MTALEPWQMIALMLLANLLGVWAGRQSRVTAVHMDLELARVALANAADEIARLRALIDGGREDTAA